jgi:phospholipid/cholesterol/gamma-HCH transport system substrate-binding protein
MNKSDYKRPFVVGAFIFVGLIMLIGGVFMVGSQQKFFEKKFTMKILFDDVSGLQPGNNVWLSGVKVGTVKKVEFYGTKQVQVTVSIEKQAQACIPKDAKSKISTDGFIGNKIVIIYGGTMEAGVANNGDVLQSEKSISTDEMVATLQINNRNLMDITDDLKKITRRIVNGEGTIGGLLNDGSMINDLQATIKNFKATSLKSKEAVANVTHFTSRLDTQNGLVNQLISDTSTFKSLEETVVQLKKAASTASIFMESMQSAGGKLSETNNPVGVLLNDEETAKNLKEMIRNLNTSSEKLNEDLEAMQHNFLFRGYFKKKEKESN